MKQSVNTETIGLTISHEWITLVMYDICCHENVLEGEV
jgi:hypothetical protein